MLPFSILVLNIYWSNDSIDSFLCSTIPSSQILHIMLSDISNILKKWGKALTQKLLDHLLVFLHVVALVLDDLLRGHLEAAKKSHDKSA